MPTKTEKLMSLINTGKINEAQDMLDAERLEGKYNPDKVKKKKGKPPRFTKKGKTIEIGKNGKWRLKVQ